MRIDFREERKWKIALAFNLAHAVVEWHEAGTLEERVRRGICVLWKRPRETEMRDEPADNSGFHAFVQRDQDVASGSASKGESTPLNEDNSDDDSDEEQERDQQDVIDALDPSTTIQEALDDAELLNSQSSQDIQPKEEDVDDTSALRRAVSEMATQIDESLAAGPSVAVRANEMSESAGLKNSSGNPMLAPHAEGSESASTSAKSKSRNGLFAPLREEIINSDLDKLFLDLDDFDLVKGMSTLSTDEMSAPPPLPDLSEIFPDAQPFGLLDVPPPPGSDGKKKSGRGDKDDPNRRTEDTTYTKVLPANDFMYHKATLLGPLQPSRHYHDDVWHDLDESAILADELATLNVDERSRSSKYRVPVTMTLFLTHA